MVQREVRGGGGRGPGEWWVRALVMQRMGLNSVRSSGSDLTSGGGVRDDGQIGGNISGGMRMHMGMGGGG